MIAADNGGTGQHVFEGQWSVDTTAHHFTFITDQIKYYGLYELNETGERSSLKIEYNKNSYPQNFSPGASFYVERLPILMIVDASRMGVL